MTPNFTAKWYEALHGKQVDGRAMTVNEARPCEERPPRSGGGGREFRG